MDWYFNHSEGTTQTRSKVKMQRQSHHDSLSSIKNYKNVPYEPNAMDENDPIRQYKVKNKPLFERIKKLYDLSVGQSLFLAHLFENKPTQVLEEKEPQERDNLNLLGFHNDLNAKHLLLSEIPLLTSKNDLAKTKSLSKIEMCKLIPNDDVELMTTTTSANQKSAQLTGIYLKNIPVKAGCWSVVNTGMTFSVHDKAVLLFVLDQSHIQNNNNEIYVQEVAIDGKDKGLLTIHCYCPPYYEGPDSTSFKLSANLFITGKSVTIPSLNISPSSVNLKKFEKTGSSDDYSNIWNIKPKKEDNVIWNFSKYPYLDEDKKIEAEIANNSSLIFLARKRNYRDGVSMGGIVIDSSGNNKLTMMPKNMIGNNTCAFQAFYQIPAKIKEVETFKTIKKSLPPSAGLNGSVFHDVPIDYKEVKKIFCKINRANNNIAYQTDYLNRPEVQSQSEIYKQNLAYLLDKVNWNNYAYNDDNFQVACDIIESVGNVPITDEDIGPYFECKKSTSESLRFYNDLVDNWLDILKKSKGNDNEQLNLEEDLHGDFDKGSITVSTVSVKPQTSKLDIENTSKERDDDTNVNDPKTPEMKIENVILDVNSEDIQKSSDEQRYDMKVSVEEPLEKQQRPNMNMNIHDESEIERVNEINKTLNFRGIKRNTIDDKNNNTDIDMDTDMEDINNPENVTELEPLKKHKNK